LVMDEDDNVVSLHTVATICAVCNQLAEMAGDAGQEKLRIGLEPWRWRRRASL
jgi:hypothetical protein